MPRLSLRQLMQLVILAAAAALCLAPFVRLAEAEVVPWSLVLMGAAVGVPLALATVALPLLRPGPAKDRGVIALLSLSLFAAIAIAAHPLLGPSPILSSGFPRGGLFFVIAILSVPALLVLYLLRKTR